MTPRSVVWRPKAGRSEQPGNSSGLSDQESVYVELKLRLADSLKSSPPTAPHDPARSCQGSSL